MTLVLSRKKGQQIKIGDNITVADVVWSGPQPTLAARAADAGVKKTAPSKALADVVRTAVKKKRPVHFLAPYRAEHVVKIAALTGIPPAKVRDKMGIDIDTVRAVVTHRMHVMAAYAHEVVGRVYQDEIRRAGLESRSLLKPVKRWLSRESLLDEPTRARLSQALEHSQALARVHQFKHSLQSLWSARSAAPETMVAALQEWCRQAEETGIGALAEFAASLRRYSLRPA